MSGLTEFLLARLAEDEACWPDPGHASYCEQRSCTCGVDRERVLADVEAKRRIVTTWALLDECPPPMPAEPTKYVAAGYRDAIAMLAEVYADHPDYREEWSA